MTKEEKLKKFEKYVIEKAEKDRQEHLEKQNKEIESQLEKKLHEIEISNEKSLSLEIEELFSEKNRRLQREKNKLKQQIAILKKEKRVLAKQEALHKLTEYTNEEDYIEKMTSKLMRESPCISEFVFCSNDMRYFYQIQQATQGKKVSFTGDFIGGYQAFILPNIIIDNSFSKTLDMF